MLTRNARRLAFVAAMLGLVLLIRAWIDDRVRDDNVPRASSNDARRLVSPAPGRVDAVAPASDVSDAVGSRGASRGEVSATEPSNQLNEARVRLEVRAPSDVRVGDVFEVRIEINANAAVHELMFLVGYPASHLTLAGWSRGNFTQQRDLPADFGAEEPSDGNIQVTYNASNGLSAAGAGSVVVLEFEAITPGTSAITLQNVTASDVGGNMDPKTFAVHDARVTIR